MGRRHKYNIHQQVVLEMMEYYSGGMPIRVVAEDYMISPTTLVKLIKEYKQAHGEFSLRLKPARRGKGDGNRYSKARKK